MKMSETKQTIVFIHGAWHGAWCWDEWLDIFNAAGYNAVAVDLRGHGYKTGSYGRARLKNYVSDVKLFTDNFETPPVLIGHSLGCSIIQHIIEKQEYPAAVMLAPIPSAQLFRRIFLVQLVKHPVLSIKSVLTLNMKPWVVSKKSIKLFFSQRMDHTQARVILKRMQGESIGLFLIDLFKERPTVLSQTPKLVIAAEKDSFFKVNYQSRTADIINAEFMIALQSGHEVMLDVGNSIVAEKIKLWLKNTK